jgi:pilus assembly protein Flp/PilA
MAKPTLALPHGWSFPHGWPFKDSFMPSCKPLIAKLLTEDSGQDMIEYALLAALLALGSTAAMTPLATAIGSAFAKVGTKLATAV